MQRDIQAKGLPLTNAIRRAVERVAAADLARFADDIHSLKVRVFAIRGSRAGANKACRVHARLHSGPELVLLDLQEDHIVAIQSAFARLRYSLARQLRRRPHTPPSIGRRGTGSLAA